MYICSLTAFCVLQQILNRLIQNTCSKTQGQVNFSVIYLFVNLKLSLEVNPECSGIHLLSIRHHFSTHAIAVSGSSQTGQFSSKWRWILANGSLYGPLKYLQPASPPLMQNYLNLLAFKVDSNVDSLQSSISTQVYLLRFVAKLVRFQLEVL